MGFFFFQKHLFSIASFPPSVPQKCTVELSVQCVQRSADVCACPYLSRSPWALLSAPLQVSSKCSHRVMLEKKKTGTQHLATAQLSLLTLNHPASSLAAGEAPLGATAPGTGQSLRGENISPPAVPQRHRQPLHPHGALLPKQLLIPPARPPGGFL